MACGDSVKQVFKRGGGGIYDKNHNNLGGKNSFFLVQQIYTPELASFKLQSH